jgi:hypothetical protein
MGVWVTHPIACNCIQFIRELFDGCTGGDPMQERVVDVEIPRDDVEHGMAICSPGIVDATAGIGKPS